MAKTFDTKAYIAALEEFVDRQNQAGVLRLRDDADEALVELAVASHTARKVKRESEALEAQSETAKLAWMSERDDDMEETDPYPSKILPTIDAFIADAELSVRADNALRANLVVGNSLCNLLRLTETEILEWKNCGRRTLNEVKELLQRRGLRLDMTLEEAEAAYKKP